MLGRSLKALFSNFLTGGISDSDDFELMRMVLVVNLFGVGLVLAAFLWGYIYFSWGALVLTYNLVAGGICGAILMWIARQKRDLVFVAQVSTFVFFVVILIDEYFTGGIRSVHTISWLCAVPIVAIFLNGLRSGLIWSVLVLAEFLFFFFLEIIGYSVPNVVPASKQATFDILCPGTCIITLFLIVVFFEITKNRAISLMKERQRELTTSEKRFRDIATSMADWIWEVDERGTYTYCSEGVKDILGFEPQELIGKTPFDLMSPDEASDLRNKFWEIAKKAQPFHSLRNRNICKDGKEIVTLTSGTPMFAEDGRFCGYRGVDRDITEREQMIKELRDSEERYRALFQQNPDAIFIADFNGNFLSVNKTTCDKLGYSEEELCSMNIQDVLSEGSKKAQKERLIDIQLREEPLAVSEYEVKAKNGETYIAEAHSVPYVVNGRTVGFQCVARDITERKYMEKALRKSEERLHSLFTSAPIGIYRNTPGPKGRFLVVNSAMINIFAYKSEDELLKVDICDLYQRPEQRKVFSDTLIEYGYINGKELKLKKRDGTPIICQVFAVLQKDEKGAPAYFDGFIVDITKRKRAEEAKAVAEAQLHQAQKMEAIGTLAGGIAHDFNNLLTVIIGNLSLAKVKAPELLQHYLENALKAANRSTDLVQQILLFSRKAQSDFQILDLGPAVKGTTDLLRQAIDRRIAIHTHIEPGLWMCNADIGQIQQVIMNLIVNARDALMECLEDSLKIHSGRIDKDFIITVELKNIAVDKEYVSLHHGSREGEFVLLVVSDNGAGMDKETLEHIFDPFFTTKDRDKGTGLGLATVHGIVQQHGGWIDVHSMPGQGSSFYVYLPRASKEGGRREIQISSVQGRDGTETILLVDDEDMILDLGKTILEDEGYRVLLARNGKETLSIYSKEQEKIDLVILDISMPVMSGTETLQQILKLDPKAKVIISSGYSTNDQRVELETLGAIEFIDKPYSTNELPCKVREVLDAQYSVSSKQ
ncbi:MAG: PAS domain S-box protein [Deltaproteobacteria bacterium]|nr:PAS domain S-box protein [Deltaproteobacteria bacterium]